MTSDVEKYETQKLSNHAEVASSSEGCLPDAKFPVSGWKAWSQLPDWREEVTLLDIADTLQILFTRNDTLCKAALNLYKVIDPSAEYIFTGIKVDGSKQEAIRKALGTEYRTGSTELVGSVKHDIETILDYEKLLKRSKPDKRVQPSLASEASLTAPLDPVKVTQDSGDCDFLSRLTDTLAPDPFEACLPSQDNVRSSQWMEEAFGLSCDQRQQPYTDVLLTGSTVTIVWSSILNMSIIYEDTPIADATTWEEVSKVTPTFTCIKRFFILESHREMAREMFHRRVHKSVTHLRNKLKSFDDLYQTDREEGGMSERDVVQSLLKTHFVLSEDPSERMQSTQLIDLICNKLSTACQAFRSRIPGYLLENGLSKKRLATGNYYYGIRPTISTDFQLNKAHTLEELETQRDKQLDSIKRKGDGTTSEVSLAYSSKPPVETTDH